MKKRQTGKTQYLLSKYSWPCRRSFSRIRTTNKICPLAVYAESPWRAAHSSLISVWHLRSARHERTAAESLSSCNIYTHLFRFNSLLSFFTSRQPRLLGLNYTGYTLYLFPVVLLNARARVLFELSWRERRRGGSGDRKKGERILWQEEVSSKYFMIVFLPFRFSTRCDTIQLLLSEHVNIAGARGKGKRKKKTAANAGDWNSSAGEITNSVELVA